MARAGVGQPHRSKSPDVGMKTRAAKSEEGVKNLPRGVVHQSTNVIKENNEPFKHASVLHRPEEIDIRAQGHRHPGVHTGDVYVHQTPSSENKDGMTSEHDPHVRAGFMAQHGTKHGPSHQTRGDQF